MTSSLTPGGIGPSSAGLPSRSKRAGVRCPGPRLPRAGRVGPLPRPTRPERRRRGDDRPGALTALRYGGSMTNHPQYRWKSMIGPRDRRPPHEGTWYAHSTNGWGIFDFLNFGEAAGLVARSPPSTPTRPPADLVDFVEYANGPARLAEWGRKRACSTAIRRLTGLKHLEIGNEEAVNDDVLARKFRADRRGRSGPRTRT